jgi:leucyl aminopeptidase
MARAAVVMPALGKLPAADAAEAIVTGLLLANFDDRHHKGTAQKKDDAAPRRLDVTLIATAAIGPAVRRAVLIADAQNFCRTLANRPGNEINPPSLARVARDVAKAAGLKCTIMDEKRLAKLGMGGILAVGAGSIATPPRMIVLEHRGGSSKSKPLLVVGKAITFDTGGISIKPADKMGKMIYDKCGGVAVLGLMYAAAKLRCPSMSSAFSPRRKRDQLPRLSPRRHHPHVQRRHRRGHQHRRRRPPRARRRAEPGASRPIRRRPWWTWPRSRAASSSPSAAKSPD